MNVTVKSRHMETSDMVRQYVEGKVQKLQRLYEGIHSIEVILDMQADQAVVEVVVQARKKHTFVASHRDENMYACVDICVGKVATQLRRFKDRVRDRQGPSIGAMPESTG